MKGAFGALLLASAGPALAEGLTLVPPIDCDLTQTCYIQQFTDHDPGPGAQDFTCGTLSYDGHKGTDFALPSLAMQAAGVDVLASAAGTVRATRDGMADILQGTPGAPDVSQVECGNGVVITHPDGWETQYCHMAKGSIAVEPGQEVAAGTVLGRVGLSGQTQFPHVHLSVRKDDQVVDPFAPGAEACDAPATLSLWSDPQPPAPQGGIIASGWAQDVPEYEAVKAGTADTGIAAGGNLVIWAYLFGGQAGDVVTLRIAGPAGEVYALDVVLSRTQAQLFRAGGRRVPAGGWPPGTYRGTALLTRGTVEIDRQEFTALLP